MQQPEKFERRIPLDQNVSFDYSQRSKTPVTLAMPANGIFSRQQFVNQIFDGLSNHFFSRILDKLSTTSFALKVLVAVMNFAVLDNLT